MEADKFFHREKRKDDDEHEMKTPLRKGLKRKTHAHTTNPTITFPLDLSSPLPLFYLIRN